MNKKCVSFALLSASAALLSGCATGPFVNHSAGTRYSCDNGSEIVVRSDGSATLQGGRGTVVLLRDAGGVGPAQAVYSNPQVRLETGLGDDARGAQIVGLVPGGGARCTQRPAWWRW